MEIGNFDWNSLEKNLGAAAKKEKKSFKDDRFWKLSRDENDNGVAMIRLLPDVNGTPFIQMFSHAIQSFDPVQKKKRWFLRNSPQTIGGDCPASELWSAIFNIGTQEGKEEGRYFSRKMKFYTNVKIIKDPANKENEGKIFLWEFGTKLKDKFMAALKPSETDIEMGEEPKQLFHPIKGCNVRLKIAKVAGFLNYDATTIEAPSSVYEDIEAAKEDIKENTYDLSQFEKPDSFETYAELMKSLKYVMEVYTPKHVDPTIFKNAIAPVLGDKVVEAIEKAASIEQAPTTQPTVTATATDAASDASVTTSDMSIEEAPKEKKVEPVRSAPVDEDGALDFLDEL